MEGADLNQQLVEITINHKGVDVAAVVTLEEANILLNDEEAATKYAEAVLAQQAPTEVTTSTAISDEGPKQHTDNNCSSREATLLFLNLRIKNNDKFNDKKTMKSSLWQKIAGEMKTKGYDMPEGRDGAEKCRQKFANLQRTYVNYIKHLKTTGTERKDPPPYFDEMNIILGNKDKISPPYLEDSLDVNIDEPTATCSSSSSSSTSNEQNCCSSYINKQKEIKNRFSSSHTSVRPTTNFNKVLELFKEQHEQLRQDKEKHMNMLESAIKVQNEQRYRFLDILQKASKRKRRNSSTSSDE